MRSLFPHLLIPTEIKNEFARGAHRHTDRNYVLERLKPDYGFYRLCTKFDTLAKVVLETTPGIDKGEAEAIAQQKSVSSSYFLADDKTFHTAIRKVDSTVSVISSLHLAAMIDIQRLDAVPNHFIRELYSVWKFSSAEFREAYTQVVGWYSLSMSKREISKKTSLKTILEV
ncbi:MAG: hypothetical protein RIF36_17120 [Imperialibacter sp.]|uniref:hypothetical protein n=1 Tax=Imperialibacter sp. TaxID=2038411 RepID=UPI0032EC051E